MSSAKSKSSSAEVSVHWIPLFLSTFLLLMSQSMAKRKRNGDIMQPCLILSGLRNSLSNAVHRKSSYSILMMLTILASKDFPQRLTVHDIKSFLKVNIQDIEVAVP